MTMDRHRSRATDPPDVGALVLEIERLGDAVEALAQGLIELRIDVDEVRQRRRRTAPPGCVAIKVGAGRIGYSTACVRTWCVKYGAEIGATRVGGGWYCELPKLEAFARTRRARVRRAA
jgi:hypothetical protein